jgi:uncharacterized protein (TIGR02271 family)
MAKTVVGVYENHEKAERAVRDLVDAGFQRTDVSIVARGREDEPQGTTTGTTTGTSGEEHSRAGTGAATGAGIGAAIGGVGGLLAGLGLFAIPGFGPVIAAGPIAAALTGAGLGAAAGGLVGVLVGLGIPKEEAEPYAEAVRRGGYLVIVNAAADEDAGRAADILDRHDPVDIEERAEYWRQSGWQGYDPKAGPYTGPNLSEEKIPVVEEQLKVGKREVERGGVRIRSYVVEKPVEADVSLREEQVHVSRTPVDRPATGEDIAAGERVIEATEVVEEPVVGKEQRVVEEVAVEKHVRERKEHVSDTVRRTEVDVEQPGTERAGRPRERVD